MSFIAAVTQPDWIRVLRRFGYEGEVNFWRPSGSGLSTDHLGKQFVLVVKGKWPREVAGYGTVIGYTKTAVRTAWDRWGTKNGVETLEQFKGRLQKVRKGYLSNEGSQKRISRGHEPVSEVTDGFTIGSIILGDLVLFPEGRYREDVVLPGFPKHLVHYAVMSIPFPFQVISALDQAAVSAAATKEDSTSSAPNALSEEQIDAIESRAVEVCQQVFSGWELTDVSTPERALPVVGAPYPGYDILARQGSLELHIEVKGTTMGHPKVRITSNELKHAATDGQARLLVVKDVSLRLDRGRWVGIGGNPTLYHWLGAPHLLGLFSFLKSKSELHGLTIGHGHWELQVEETDLLAVVSIGP